MPAVNRLPFTLSNRLAILCIALLGSAPVAHANSVTPADDSPASIQSQLIQTEHSRILTKATEYLSVKPSTIVDYVSPRSSGTAHDFYSEGDYWWPNPEDPSGPYIRRDGLSNPDNFIKHRLQLIELSDIVATLASAYILEQDQKYLTQIDNHLNAWFVNGKTKMAPHLNYGQAIKGRNTGRSIGVIDTIHLTEVARSIYQLEQLTPGALTSAAATKKWFAEYLQWLLESPFGQTERQHPNNHGVCWAMQAAAFAQLTGNTQLLDEIREDFKNVFIKQMMATDGSFPAELARTKPYGYSLFVLDAMATNAQLLSNAEHDMWRFSTKDGRGMQRAVEYMLPYVQDKSSWPLKPDVLYWDNWPVRQPAFVFAALHFKNSAYFNAWVTEEADPSEYEVLRNLPVRHPLIWLDALSLGENK